MFEVLEGSTVDRNWGAKELEITWNQIFSAENLITYVEVV